jgi:hypothetical protein
MGIGRDPFRAVVLRQLERFEQENEGLIRECEQALAAYNTAPADEAEARYEGFLDLAETGRDELAALRDTYRRTLEPEVAEAYDASFNRLVRKRLPRFALEIEL